MEIHEASGPNSGKDHQLPSESGSKDLLDLLKDSPTTANDTANSVLLSMLDGEVHRLRAAERTNKEGAERTQRDQKRMAVMLSMSQSQIEKLMDQVKELSAAVDEKRKVIVALEDEKRDIHRSYHSATEDTRAAKVIAEAKTSKFLSEINGLERKQEEMENKIKQLTGELESERRSHEETKRMNQLEARKGFEVRVAIETRLKTLEEDNRFIQEMRAKESKAAVLKEYELSTTNTKLKSEINESQAKLSTQSKESMDAFYGLKTENAMLSQRCETLNGKLQEVERSSLKEKLQLESELSAKKEEFEELLLSSSAREKTLEAQVAQFTSSLKSAQAEVNLLVDDKESNNRSLVEDIISLKATIDALKKEQMVCLNDIEKAKADGRQKDVTIALNADTHKKQSDAKEREHDAKVAALTGEMEAKESDLQWNLMKLKSTEDELSKVRDELAKAREIHYNDSNALKAEVTGYKEAVKKLESHINENIEGKLLREANVNLQKQISHLKNQLVSSNNAVANARIEEDIAENYKAQIMREEVEDQRRRVCALERERTSARTLMTQLLHYYNKVQGLIASSPDKISAADLLKYEADISFTNASSTAAALVPHNTGGGVGDHAGSLDIAKTARAIDAFYSTFGGEPVQQRR